MGSYCFAKGTMITTDKGHVAIEDLRPGDQVLTTSSAYQTIRWIGWNHVDFKTLSAAEKSRNLPVLIPTSALMTGIPCQDLVLSASHAVLVCGKLMTAGSLLNLQNRRIRGLEDMQTITYYHIECDQFEVIYANDLPAESYVDVGNRSCFQNFIGEPAHQFRNMGAYQPRIKQVVAASRRVPLQRWGSHSAVKDHSTATAR